MSSNTSRRYPSELRERAVRMVAEVRSEHVSEWAAMESVAQKLGIGTTQTLHNWVRRAEIDSGKRIRGGLRYGGGTPQAAGREPRVKARQRILKSTSTF